jgi:hypothetical protein
MSKSRIGVIFILVLLATSLTFAQSFFSQPSSPASNSGTPNPMMTPKPLSPDDFKNLVKQQNQQTQAQMSQQLNQKFSSQPALQTTPTSTTTKDQNTSHDESTPSTASTPAEEPAGTPPTLQSQEYTGFSSGSTNNTGTNNQNTPKKQSGLGIQY